VSRPELRPSEIAAAAAIALLAAVLLFWGLGDKYLWQDEAATAVLGERMLRYGKPLSYDGKNLITMDYVVPSDTQKMDSATGSARAAVDYLVERGDFKPDTTWIGHPWGQFLLAGVSLRAFGHGTVQARLPFAAAAWLTVVLLYVFVRREFRDPRMAAAAASLLAVNAYWILHCRQCRYYAPSSLLLLLTLVAWAHWRRGGRYGGALVVAAGWCWFQMDFGSFWPSVAVLLTLAAFEDLPDWKATTTVAVTLAVTIAPWVWYYELAGRYKGSDLSWKTRFLGNIEQTNHFVAPLLLLVAAAILLWRGRASLGPGPRRILLACLATITLMIVWVPSVAPEYFLRYVVHLAPLACIVAAWVVARFGDWIERRTGWRRRWSRAVVTAVAVAFLALSPLSSAPVAWLIPRKGLVRHKIGVVLRPEMGILISEVFGHRDDPNRAGVEWVASRARPGDEVLVSYEDIPFMFYTDLPVRGGVPCFRVEDRSSAPARFFVVRKNLPLNYWPPFLREVVRSNWNQEELPVAAFPWGNNPDPEAQPALFPEGGPPRLLVGERIGSR
jgi:4-amino-4-deoxy-L-arabinose transferase-like glycosyltransferase